MAVPNSAQGIYGSDVRGFMDEYLQQRQSAAGQYDRDRAQFGALGCEMAVQQRALRAFEAAKPFPESASKLLLII